MVEAPAVHRQIQKVREECAAAQHSQSVGAIYQEIPALPPPVAAYPIRPSIAPLPSHILLEPLIFHLPLFQMVMLVF